MELGAYGLVDDGTNLVQAKHLAIFAQPLLKNKGPDNSNLITIKEHDVIGEYNADTWLVASRQV